jgi:predicted lipid-binding transport protein (Tim44 family)
MHNARFRLMAGLAGATLCLFAVTAYGQNPTTTTTTGSAQTPAPTTPTATDQTTPAPTTPDANATVTRTTATDVSTTTSTTSFPGGMLGILAVAVLVLLLLFGLFRGRDRTVIKESYVAPPAAGTRTVTTSTTDDRMNLNSRAASGPGTTPGGVNDPNARR